MFQTTNQQPSSHQFPDFPTKSPDDFPPRRPQKGRTTEETAAARLKRCVGMMAGSSRAPSAPWAPWAPWAPSFLGAVESRSRSQRSQHFMGKYRKIWDNDG